MARELPDGEVGRLWIDAPTAALMYWEDREASVRTYAGDTVMSGDLFVRDADGYFTFQGRADDLIKVSGVWVAPFEVERALLEHPDVVECAVVGVKRDGLTVTRAHVVLRAGLEGVRRARRGAAAIRSRAAVATQVPTRDRVRR